MLFCPLDLRRYLLLVAALGLLAGCGQRDQITRYSVPKPELVDPTRQASHTSAPPAAAVPQQTLGAIAIVQDTGWFFKLVGDPELVQPQRERFVEFVKSIRFSGENAAPTWTLPEGWTELPGDQFRTATIAVPSDGQTLELAISKLEKDAEYESDKYLLDNVNRWRNQMGQPPISAGELSSETETVQAGDLEMTLVDVVGTGAAGGPMAGMMAGPFAGGAGTPPASSAPGRSAAGDSPVEYDAPAEWTVIPPKTFGIAAFEVVDGRQRVEITLSTAGGDLRANVNRWRGQIGLEPWSPEELDANLKEIETLGTMGRYAELVGSDGTILGVVTQAGGDQWFIKLTGPRELAEREKPRFEAFVRSLKLQ